MVFQLTKYSVKALAYLLARRPAILSNSVLFSKIACGVAYSTAKADVGHNFKATANRGVNVWQGNWNTIPILETQVRSH